MNRFLSYFLLTFVIAGIAAIAGAAVPVITYNSTNTYTAGTAISTLTPTVTNGVSSFGYGAGVNFTGGTLTNPYGLALDASGNVYAANLGVPNVLKYTSAGAYTAIFASSGTPALTNITGIGFDGSGNAYLTRKGGNLYKFSSSGAYVSTLTTAPSSAYGIAVDASGNSYIADYTNGAVTKYSNTGTLLLTIPTSSTLSKPVGVAVDAAGNIYILDNSKQDIVKYSATGTYISTLVSTGIFYHRLWIKYRQLGEPLC